MPLYEYECFLCRHRFERIQRVSSDPVRECPDCGGAVRRLLGTPALQFKGSGWYVTDYGNGRSSGTTETNNGKGAEDSGGTKEAPAASSDSSDSGPEKSTSS